MSFYKVFGFSVLLSSCLAFGGPISDSQKTRHEEDAKLIRLLNGRTLICTGPHQFVLRGEGGVPVLRTSYGETSGPAEINQLSVGALIMIYVSGPDTSEGGAALVINPNYFSGALSKMEVSFSADALVFNGEVGTGSAGETLQCTIKL